MCSQRYPELGHGGLPEEAGQGHHGHREGPGDCGQLLQCAPPSPWIQGVQTAEAAGELWISLPVFRVFPGRVGPAGQLEVESGTKGEGGSDLSAALEWGTRLSPEEIDNEESFEDRHAEDQPGAETGCNLMGIFCPNDFKREALKYVKISIMILFLLSVVDIF